MLISLIIWCAVALVPLGVGVRTLLSREPAAFFAGTKPPAVTDAKRYNRAVALLWFVYAAVFAAAGIPLLYLKQHPVGFVWCILGVVGGSIALAAAYTAVEKKYRVKPNRPEEKDEHENPL